jgi:hypothetical protein
MPTAVLNKTSIREFVLFLRILARVGSSPSENLDEGLFESLPPSEQTIALVAAPIIARGFARSAGILEAKSTLRRDEIAPILLKEVSDEVKQFIANPRNEKLLIGLSKASKSQSAEWAELIREGEAHMLEKHPDASISEMAGFALIGDVINGLRQMTDETILPMFDIIAGKQAKQLPPREPPKNRFKTRKSKK